MFVVLFLFVYLQNKILTYLDIQKEKLIKYFEESKKGRIFACFIWLHAYTLIPMSEKKDFISSRKRVTYLDSSRLKGKTPSQYLINYRKVSQIIADEQLKISRDVKRMWAKMFTLWEKDHVYGVAGDWETWRRDNYSIDWDEIIELFVYEELRSKYNFCGYIPQFNRYYTDCIRPQILSIC